MSKERVTKEVYFDPIYKEAEFVFNKTENFYERQAELIERLDLEVVLNELVSEANQETKQGQALRHSFGFRGGRFSLEVRDFKENAPDFIIREEIPELDSGIPILGTAVFSINDTELKYFPPLSQELENSDSEQDLFVVMASPGVIDAKLKPDHFIEYTIYPCETSKDFVESLADYASSRFSRGKSTAMNYDRTKAKIRRERPYTVIGSDWSDLTRKKARRRMRRAHFGHRVFRVFARTFRDAIGIDVY